MEMALPCEHKATLRKIIKAFEALGFHRNNQEEIGACTWGCVHGEHEGWQQLLRELCGFY